MAINNDTLSVDVFETIRAVIVAAAPKITNSTTSGTKTASVLASHNDKSTTTPQIVINPIATDESDYKFGESQGKKFINVGIECYYKNTLGVDQLSDATIKAIKDAVDDGTIVDMDLVGVSSEYAFVDPNQTKFQLKTISFTFDKE